MPIEVSWFNGAHSVILMEFPQRWTWREFYDAKMEADTMMEAVDYPCALILTGPSDVIMPENVLSNARMMLNQKHPRAEVFMVVSPNPFVHALLNMLMRVSRDAARGVRIVGSVEAAQASLMEMGYLRGEKA